MAQQLHGNSLGPAAHAPTAHQHRERLLLLYVVDYCEKRQYKDAAAALRREGHLPPSAKAPIDSKEGLLFEWWTCFWEIYTARVHPDKAHSSVAKRYSDNLRQNGYGQPRDAGQPSNGRMGGPAGGGAASQTPPGVNGQGPPPSYTSNPPNMNGVQPLPNPSGGAMPGMAASAANPTHHNPNLQHLQNVAQRYPQPTPGMPMQPMYAQRPPGPPMGPGGPMQMGASMQPQQRMPNGTAVYPQNPNYRPPGAHQSPQQHQEMQGAGASGSPKQPANAQNSSPHLQEATRNGNPYEASGAESHLHGTPRTNPNRGQKRPSSPEDEQYFKDESPPSNKRPRRSPQENGSTLPNTPSLTPAQPPGNARPPAGAGPYGIPPNKSNTLPFVPPGVANIAGGLPSAMAGQLQQLSNAHVQRSQGTMGQQTDQQYFAQMQQTAVATYNIKSAYQAPQNAGPPGLPNEQSIRGATNAPKGSMLPPPPPASTTNQPTQGTNGTPNKNTAGTSGLVPRNAGNKDGSSPGREGVSPESVRPGSRPMLGSTPQMTPASMPGTASTPGGGPSAISAPSPSQMTTPQQISRPQTQSPSSAALGRPPTATTNGLAGGGGGGPGAVPSPNSLLARFNGNAPPSGGGPGGAPGAPINQSTPAHSASGMGGSSGLLGGGEQLSSDLFMSLGNNSLAAPFDFQMMGYQEGETFAGVNFDLNTDFSMDDTYNMGMYLNEPSLDSVNGA